MLTFISAVMIYIGYLLLGRNADPFIAKIIMALGLILLVFSFKFAQKKSQRSGRKKENLAPGAAIDSSSSDYDYDVSPDSSDCSDSGDSGGCDGGGGGDD